MLASSCATLIQLAIVLGGGLAASGTEGGEPDDGAVLCGDEGVCAGTALGQDF
jgi:hypothetical protein